MLFSYRLRSHYHHHHSDKREEDKLRKLVI